MPKPFHQLSLEEFADLLARFPFRRRIDTVHFHHTWRPNHSQYRGAETIEAMWRFHTEQNGWSDIAQHISIAPDGTIWTGRDWNRAPASATGHNGNSIAGPFMFETIGDFDLGRDRFEGAQRDAVIEVIARVQMRFGLPVESLRFHNHMTDQKTCPGTAIKYDEILNAVRERRNQLEQASHDAASRNAGERPFGDDALAAPGRTSEIIASFGGNGDGRLNREMAANLELHSELTEEQTSSAAMAALFYDIDVTTQSAPITNGRRDVPRGIEFTPSILSELRPHVINLNQGRFSSGGKFDTTRGDVDAIFGEHLERELQAARARSEKLRVVLYAHGGLVSESSGLEIAHKHINWWLKNHVYPIYFVWETGLFETIGQILQGTRQRAAAAGARDIFDVTTDPMVEAVARKLGGEKIWSGMKRSAELASADDGGARYVADRLKQFCDAHQGEVKLYAVGHSAGSIFHAHFIPMALNLGVPHFQSVHFLAPAIRVDTFRERLAGRVGNGINQLNIFTMAKDWEKADNCAQIYRKSLLYLIHHALEPESKTPLLGLEESLRADEELTRLFGLGGHPQRNGEVIFAKSKTTTGRSATTSISHGGFDDDAATMNSVARRILNVGDEAPIINFPETAEARSVDGWNAPIEWPEEFAYRLEERAAIAPPLPMATQTTTFTKPMPVFSNVTVTGRRRALCVGINKYPTAPLMGCVADAQSWASALAHLGFETHTVLDEQATRTGILNALRELVTSSSAGDIVVFQYAGHGTQLPDHNRDEGDDRKDEALCPFDFAEGAFVIDDDVAEVFRGLPDGVNLTCFIDCCHSGTISRFAVGATDGSEARNQRMRFINATPEMEQAHLNFRQQIGASRAALPPRRGPEAMKEVVFSACLPSEVAWESEGHGDFTVRATKLLLSGSNVTHEEFQRQVIAAFGSTPRQHPTLDCAPLSRALGLLQARAKSAGGRPPITAKAAAGK